MLSNKHSPPFYQQLKKKYYQEKKYSLFSLDFFYTLVVKQFIKSHNSFRMFCTICCSSATALIDLKTSLMLLKIRVAYNRNEPITSSIHGRRSTHPCFR